MSDEPTIGNVVARMDEIESIIAKLFARVPLLGFQIDLLDARVTTLEAAIAWQRGTAARTPEEGATIYTHDVPPDAPR